MSPLEAFRLENRRILTSVRYRSEERHFGPRDSVQRQSDSTDLKFIRDKLQTAVRRSNEAGSVVARGQRELTRNLFGISTRPPSRQSNRESCGRGLKQVVIRLAGDDAGPSSPRHALIRAGGNAGRQSAAGSYKDPANAAIRKLSWNPRRASNQPRRDYYLHLKRTRNARRAEGAHARDPNMAARLIGCLRWIPDRSRAARRVRKREEPS